MYIEKLIQELKEKLSKGMGVNKKKANSFFYWSFGLK